MFKYLFCLFYYMEADKAKKEADLPSAGSFPKYRQYQVLARNPEFHRGLLHGLQSPKYRDLSFLLLPPQPRYQEAGSNAEQVKLEPML